MVLNSDLLKSAYDYYSESQDKDFVYYEHLGSVRQPVKMQRRSKRESIVTDSSVDEWSMYTSAADILTGMGIDSNTLGIMNISAQCDSPSRRNGETSVNLLLRTRLSINGLCIPLQPIL
ncbi:MAG: hypothetical protein ACKPKO_02140, partial [Candidatus Fonsibacter sp.]